VDGYFADRPPALRRIHDVVVRHLRKLGPLTVEAVGVGILIKPPPTGSRTSSRCARPRTWIATCAAG
jgi:hypothetical protein